MLTLGTGVGGCVMVEGHIMRGSHGEPPEIGAMILDDGGPSRASGRPGSLESLACAAGFLAAYREAGGRKPVGSVKNLFSLAGSDPQAAAAIDGIARRIAQAIGSLTNALVVDGCVTGGGIAQAGEELVGRIDRHLPSFTWPLLFNGLTLVPAAHGSGAGLIGVASLAAEALP